MPFGENKSHENRGYRWRGFGFLPRNPFARNRGREHHGHERHHTYNLSIVASGATWFIACTFIVAIVNTDWTPEPTLPNSPRIDMEPNIIHEKLKEPNIIHEKGFRPWSHPAHDLGQRFIAANDSSIHVSLTQERFLVYKSRLTFLIVCWPLGSLNCGYRYFCFEYHGTYVSWYFQTLCLIQGNSI